MSEAMTTDEARGLLGQLVEVSWYETPVRLLKVYPEGTIAVDTGSRILAGTLADVKVAR